MIATYANQDVRVTKNENNNPPIGSRMRLVPSNIGSFWTTYEIQDGALSGWKMGGGVTIQDSSVDQSNTLKNPGYATVDLMTGYSMDIGKSKITAQFNISNLLDKNVFNTAVVEGGAFGSFITPRTFMGSINVQY